MATVTVVIPTCGAAPHLTTVLIGLSHQTRKDFDVVIVDNNLERQVSHRLLEAVACRPTVLHEPRNGLSIARNTGIAASRGECIAFLDDDGVPMPTWLDELLKGLCHYGGAGAGGSVDLSLLGTAPPWLTAPERALLSELTYQSIDIPEIGEDSYVVGANMCFRRATFERYGGFDPAFGRTATSLRSSEELEFTRRVQTAGERISFLAAARVCHLIPAHRLTARYILRRSYWQGRSDALLEARWGRPKAFGRRGFRANLNSVIRAAKLSCREARTVEGVRQRFQLARELGYAYQVGLLAIGLGRD